MPDDCILGFVFKTGDNELGLANDSASLAAAEQVQEVIARFANFDQPDNKWGNAAEAVTEATLRKGGRDVIDQDPDWDDLVPPDLLNDGSGFLLG